jgi:cardiolipin synthase
MVTALWTGLSILIHLAFIARAILRPHREPASRVAWVVVIVVLPVAGILAYILLGETNIGRRRAARVREVLARLPDTAVAPGSNAAEIQPAIPDRYAPLFRVGHSVNGFEPVGGNRARLMADSNAAIESMIADIEAAHDHVHLTFYIWLPDNNGLTMVWSSPRPTTCPTSRCRPRCAPVPAVASPQP